MAKVINFLDARKKNSTSFPMTTRNDLNIYNSALRTVDDVDNYLIDLIYQWPCFDRETVQYSLKDLLEKYCNQELLSEQECVLDFVLHIHDPSFMFDVSFALTIWNDQERLFFKFFIDEFSQVLRNERNK